jgi:hypothetical protein
MKYSKRKYRDASVEIIEKVVVTKKKKVKKQTQKRGFFRKLWDRINPFKK